jgi:hypothetical protein
LAIGSAVKAAPRLSSVDKYCLAMVRKHGELILSEDGDCFGCVNSYGSQKRSRVERLAALGLLRIDKVGQSTFVVSVE